MTKVSVFGQQPTETKELKKIEFVKVLDESFNSCFDEEITDGIKPKRWENVSLITKNNNGNGMDLILAWDGEIDKKLGCPIMATLFLGHWNDGIV